MVRTASLGLVFLSTTVACISGEQQEQLDACCACLEGESPADGVDTCLESDDVGNCVEELKPGFLLGADAANIGVSRASCMKDICLDACKPLIEAGFVFEAKAESAGTMTAELGGVPYEAAFVRATPGAGLEPDTTQVQVSGFPNGQDPSAEELFVGMFALPGPGTYDIAAFSNFELRANGARANAGSLTVTELSDDVCEGTFSATLDGAPNEVTNGAFSVGLKAHGQDGPINLSEQGAPESDD